MEAKQAENRYCGYCGHKMEFAHGGSVSRLPRGLYYYHCPLCEARTPSAPTPKIAKEKAQSVILPKDAEPRIIRASAATQSFEITNAAVWYEEVFAGMRNLQPAIITKDGSLLTEDIQLLPEELDWKNYRKTWRLWTSEPTDKHRKAVPLYE